MESFIARGVVCRGTGMMEEGNCGVLIGRIFFLQQGIDFFG